MPAFSAVQGDCERVYQEANYITVAYDLSILASFLRGNFQVVINVLVFPG